MPEKSNVMALVHQLKSGMMSKEDVLQQLRRIQLEKRSSTSRISTASSHSDDSKYNNDQSTPEDLYHDSLASSVQTRSPQMQVHDPFQSKILLESSELNDIRDSSTRSWVQEEAALLADEEEVCIATRVHTALRN